MSHFLVWVGLKDIGDLDKVMLPYHEYESTGIEEYIEKEYASDENVAEMMEAYNRDQSDTTQSPCTVEEFADDWAGYKKDEKGYYRWTNPNSKWDWYTVGGRYSGRLMLKNGGGQADVAVKRDIDFDKMQSIRVSRNLDSWDKFHEILARNNLKFEDVIGAEQKPEIDFTDFDERWLYYEFDARGAKTRDEFAEISKKEAVCFAFVDLDGKWHEVGHMGWWACVSDADNDKFDTEWREFIDTMPDETYIVSLDCHI